MLVTDAVTRAARSTQAKIDIHYRELAAVDAQTRNLDNKIERYQAAFESGQLDASTLRGRITELRDQTNQLAVRRAELVRLIAAVPAMPSQDEINNIRSHIREALGQGTGAVKRVYELLVHEVRVARARQSRRVCG